MTIKEIKRRLPPRLQKYAVEKPSGKLNDAQFRAAYWQAVHQELIESYSEIVFKLIYQEELER